MEGVWALTLFWSIPSDLFSSWSSILWAVWNCKFWLILPTWDHPCWAWRSSSELMWYFRVLIIPFRSFWSNIWSEGQNTVNLSVDASGEKSSRYNIVLREKKIMIDCVNLSRLHVYLHLLSIHNNFVPENHLVQDVWFSYIFSSQVQVECLQIFGSGQLLTCQNIAITFTFQLNKGERSAFRSKLINAWSFPELS